MHHYHWTLEFIFFNLVSLLGSSLLYWSTELITQFLDLSQAVGLLGRVISSSQGLYLNTGKYKHRKMKTHIQHPCPGRDSKPQSRPPSDQRLFMLQTARLPRPANIRITFPKYSHRIVYNETNERSSMDVGDDGIWGFFLSICCCIPLQLLLAYVNRHEVLVASVGYQTVWLSTLLWTFWLDDGRGTQESGVEETGRGRGRCWRGRAMELLAVLSV
jgi:hypothetical protein